MSNMPEAQNIEVSYTEYFTINGVKYTPEMAERLHRKLSEYLDKRKAGSGSLHYPPGVRGDIQKAETPIVTFQQRHDTKAILPGETL